ncbi:hypothetical protein PGTUg99_011250 [Puccinia graminis f. sp. tritici]|uniref:Uncharacterized protein n=1 Tax=Puccinia graminis f. sp. tritici TaxID=56615 RepID=A0A5B0RC06_PUCGR|nr:hypothetical protein PGTUg99_011250 [Puccinia graminis f. sp. tritici]
MDQAGLADHQARVAPSKPNLAWIQPSLGTSPIWSGSDPSHAWPSPSEGATHAKPGLTAQSLGSAKPDLGQCQGPTPARPAKSSPLGAGAGPGGARTRGTGACAQTRLQHHKYSHGKLLVDGLIRPEVSSQSEEGDVRRTASRSRIDQRYSDLNPPAGRDLVLSMESTVCGAALMECLGALKLIAGTWS